MLTGPLRVKGYIEVNGYKYPSGPASASGYVLISSGPNGDFYWGPPSASSVFSGNTDSVAEGGTNKYFTNARALVAVTGDQSWLTNGGWAKYSQVILVSGITNTKANQADLIQVSGLLNNLPSPTNIRFSSGVQFVSAVMTADQTTNLTIGNRVNFTSREAGNLGLSNGVFSLNSGVIYTLTAYVSDAVSGTATDYYKWYNISQSQFIENVVVTQAPETVELRIVSSGVTRINASGTSAIITSINIFPDPTGTYHNSLAGIQGGKLNNYYHSDQPIGSGDSPFFCQNLNLADATPPMRVGGLRLGHPILPGSLAGLTRLYGDTITSVGLTPTDPTYSPQILFSNLSTSTYVAGGFSNGSHGQVLIGTAGYPSGYFVAGVGSGVGRTLAIFDNIGTWFGNRLHKVSTWAQSDFGGYRVTIDQTAEASGGLRIRGTNPVGNMLEINAGNQNLFKIDNTGVMTLGNIPFPNSLAPSGQTLVSDGARLIFAPKFPKSNITVARFGGADYFTIQDAIRAASGVGALGQVTIDLYGTFTVTSPIDLTTNANYQNLIINGNGSTIYSDHSGSAFKVNSKLSINDISFYRSTNPPSNIDDGTCLEMIDGTDIKLNNVDIVNYGRALKSEAIAGDVTLNGVNLRAVSCYRFIEAQSDPIGDYTTTYNLNTLTVNPTLLELDITNRTTAIIARTGVAITANDFTDSSAITAELTNDASLVSNNMTLSNIISVILGDPYHASGVILKDQSSFTGYVKQILDNRAITALSGTPTGPTVKAWFTSSTDTTNKIISQKGNAQVTAHFTEFKLTDIERDSTTACRVFGLDRSANQYIIGTNKFPINPGVSGQSLKTDGIGGIYWG